MEKVTFNAPKPGKHNLIFSYPNKETSLAIVVQIALQTETGKRAILEIDPIQRKVTCLSNKFKLLNYSFSEQAHRFE